MMESTQKLCIQCLKQLPLTQFKTYKTKSGIKYRNRCHQCTYNNNRFNILARERTKHQLSDDEAVIFDTTLQLFDTYDSMGGDIGSGEYNKMRNKVQHEATLAEQLAQAQALYAKKVDVTEYTDTARYLKDIDTAKIDADLLKLLSQPMTEWVECKYKPSFLRSISTDLKARLVRTETGINLQVDNHLAINKLTSKVWDYEEYLAATFSDALPDWLAGEELIV